MSARGLGLALGLACLLAAAAAGAAAGRDTPFDDAEIVRAEDPAWFKTSFLDLRADLAEARAAGKQGLMILFGTQGCAYCKAFIERSLKDPDIAAVVRRHFDTLHLEMFDDADLTDFEGRSLPVKAFARREGAAFSPTVAFYGLDGRRLHRVVGYQPPARFREVLDYVVGGHHRTLAYRDYLERRAPVRTIAAAPDALRRDALFEPPPYDLDRRRPAARPLLVLFEAPGCEACRAFHAQVLVDPEVRALLARFQVVQLNARDAATLLRAPDGRRITPRRWAEELGLAPLPAMVFFDAAGREVLRNDAVTYRQRMVNSLRYVLEEAYLRGITYQRYARERTAERLAQEDPKAQP